MTKRKRENIGKISRDLAIKHDKVTHSPTDQMKEQLSEFEKNVEECLQIHKKQLEGNFYIVVLTKKEKLMSNVIRNFFYGRISCPTPNYDQVVYKYDRQSDKLDLVWVIPDRKTAKYFRDYAKEVNPSQYELLSYVLKFADGTLFRLAKKLNGEKDKTPELKDN